MRYKVIDNRTIEVVTVPYRCRLADGSIVKVTIEGQGWVSDFDQRAHCTTPQMRLEAMISCGMFHDGINMKSVCQSDQMSISCADWHFERRLTWAYWIFPVRQWVRVWPVNVAKI